MGGLLGFGGGSRIKVRPYQVVVVGTQIAAGHYAIGGALDGEAMGGAGPAIRITVLPLADLGVRSHPGTLAQLAYRESART